jgi:hypothetical protein
VSYTATRRVPGRGAEELQAAIERFLKVSRKPALLEPGEEIILLDGGNVIVALNEARLTIQAWDEHRNLVRRVVDIREQTRGRLELVAERFARKLGPLFLIDLAQSAGQDWERRGTRLVFRERFRQFLSREFPGWKLAELSTEADLQHSLSPAYPRALLQHGRSGLAAIGAAPNGVDSSAVLSFGLIWLDYLRSRKLRMTIEGLVLFIPENAHRATSLRVKFLDQNTARFDIFAYSAEDQTAPLDLGDAGNLETKLELCRRASKVDRDFLDTLLAVEGVQLVETADGEASLRMRGLEFAHTSGSEIFFGVTARIPLRKTNLAECEQLARGLARMRSPGLKRGGELYLRNPEAWLESQVRSNIEAIDASLLPSPIYGQVPAFAAGDRGIIDLLAIDRASRLAVIELKASADLHLPLQALDYWMRVNWHLDRGDFETNGYFRGIELGKSPPRLLLVAPALEFHPSTEGILSYFSKAVEVERVGLGMNWRCRLEIMFRLCGAERPV